MKTKETCRLLSFGHGGHAEFYTKRGNTKGSLSGYDKPENWEPRENTDYSNCIVINKIPALDTSEGYAYVFTGPMVDADLEGDEINECPKPSEILTEALQGNDFGKLLNLNEAQRMTGNKPSALDGVSPEAYARGWKELGAQVGRIEGNKIVWDN